MSHTQGSGPGIQDVVGEQLPKVCDHWDTLEAMGVQRVGEANSLFYNVRLPTGWHKEATRWRQGSSGLLPHPMWSDLFDDKGRKRASIFSNFIEGMEGKFKAFMNVYPRYSTSLITVEVPDSSERRLCAIVLDCDDVELFRTELIPDYPAEELDEASKQLHRQETKRIEQASKVWLKEHFPDAADLRAYWD